MGEKLAFAGEGRRRPAQYRGSMSTQRSHRAYSTAQVQGTNGRKACLQCEGDIALGSRRSVFCSPECSEEFYIRSRPGHARLRVFERDKGICSKCGKNVFAGTGRRPNSNGTGDLWQADHIVAVVEGGGECSLENLRTLCTACHKAETADLAARLANAKRLAHAERLARQPVLEFVTA